MAAVFGLNVEGVWEVELCPSAFVVAHKQHWLSDNRSDRTLSFRGEPF